MSKEDVVWPNLKNYIRTNWKYCEKWLENFSQVNYYPNPDLKQ
jgi:hypothetical protein